MLVPFAFMLLNAFKSPADYSTNGPLSWPTEFYTKGLATYWNRGELPAEAAGTRSLIAGSVAVLAVLVSLLNAYALGIGRVRGRLWIVALFLLANMLPQEALVYPLYYLAKEVGLYNTRLVGDHHLHRDPERVRHLPARLGAGHVPARAARGGRAGRRRAGGRCCGGSSSRSAGPPSSVLLIFFFIWTWNEFLIPLVMLIDNDTQTIPVALGVAAGRPADGRPDHQRRRAARPASRRSSSSSSSSAP